MAGTPDGPRKVTVVLDVDDTLLRTSSVAYRKSRRTAELLGYEPLTWPRFRAVYGRLSFEDCLVSWHGDVDPDRYSAVYETLRDEIPYEPLGDIAGLISRLRDRVSDVAVLTNGPGDKTVRKLSACGLRPAEFAFVRHADNSTFPKPAVAAFRDALGEVEPGAVVVYVSDLPADGQGALAAGMRFAGVTTGLWDADDFTKAGIAAADVLDGVHALPEWLDSPRCA